jgi:Mrp family chromosome partitioning ATPase
MPRPVERPVAERRTEQAAPALGVERVAEELRGLGNAARKITVMGMGDPASTSLTALTLARLMVREASVVLVDLSPASGALRAVMSDPATPGLSDLSVGAASFGQIITKDRMSRVQIVGAGTRKMDAAVLLTPGMTMTIDALTRVYDYVILDAGALDDVPEQLVSTNAHAVLVTVAGLDNQTREVVRSELLGAGFRGVTMLDAAGDPSLLGRPGGRMAAA